MKSIVKTMCVAAVLAVAPGAAMGQGGEADAVQQAKSALLEVLAGYEPGSPISEGLKVRVSDAAAALEQAAGGPPDLLANVEQVSGQWVNLFSSQGVVGEIDVSFMTRALPGGGHAGGKALSKVVLQELRPAENFYRNMMVMTAGEQDTPLLHVATAMVDIDRQSPNFLQVRFKRIEFLPGRADVTLEQLREALRLPEATPLAVNVPVDLSKPAAASEVTYLDGDLRINRGKNYIAILRKVH